MADSADLVVLGAYYGSGNKGAISTAHYNVFPSSLVVVCMNVFVFTGGIMSIFLMGCYDERRECFVTVTKCGNGFDDKKLEALQKELKGNMRRVEKVGQPEVKW